MQAQHEVCSGNVSFAPPFAAEEAAQRLSALSLGTAEEAAFLRPGAHTRGPKVSGALVRGPTAMLAPRMHDGCEEETS